MDKNGLANIDKNQDPVLERNAQVNLFVNQTGMDDEDEIDLGRVFHRMKCHWRSFLCMLILFVAIAMCVALIIYQATSKPLKVSSVVTLKYKVPDTVTGQQVPVSDLTAPDGTELDLSQVYTSYVLRNALKDITLSEDIPIEDIQSAITIEKMLTDESLRQQELVSTKIENKDTDAYEAVENLDISYKNMFIVSLINRFGREKLELPDEELRELLDAILRAYNDYLLEYYPGLKLPDDEIGAIRVDNIDILESLDQLRASVKNLSNYCSNKDPEIRNYRSFRTGRTLVDWSEELRTVKEVYIDYLYASINSNNIEDQNATLTNYESRLQDAKAQLDDVNRRIASLAEIIANYENENVYVAVQDNQTARSTTITSDYYNELVLQQAANYAEASSIEATISLLEERIYRLENNASSEESVTVTTEEAKEELSSVLAAAHRVYESIESHMQEIMDQPLYRNYTEHSSAVGKTEFFLTAAKKNLLICVGVAALLAFLVWFFKGLGPEFAARREQKKENDSGNDTQSNARDQYSGANIASSAIDTAQVSGTNITGIEDPGGHTSESEAKDSNPDSRTFRSKVRDKDSERSDSGIRGRKMKKPGKEDAK